MNDYVERLTYEHVRPTEHRRCGSVMQSLRAIRAGGEWIGRTRPIVGNVAVLR